MIVQFGINKLYEKMKRTFHGLILQRIFRKLKQRKHEKSKVNNFINYRLDIVEKFLVSVMQFGINLQEI